MQSNDALLQELLSQVKTADKYSQISEDLILEIGKIELSKRNSLKEAVK